MFILSFGPPWETNVWQSPITPESWTAVLAKELNLKQQPLGPRTLAMAAAAAAAGRGGHGIPGSPCAGRAWGERARRAQRRHQRALRRHHLQWQGCCEGGGAVHPLPFSRSRCNLSMSRVQHRWSRGMCGLNTRRCRCLISLWGPVPPYVRRWPIRLSVCPLVLLTVSGLALVTRVCCTIVRSCLQNTGHHSWWWGPQARRPEVKHPSTGQLPGPIVGWPSA